MLKKIATSQLQTGMFIERIDAPWFQHSLWKTRFLISDRATLTRVRTCGAKECWIDTAQGKDLSPPPVTPVQSKVVAEATAAPKPVVRRSMGDELQTASDIIKRSKAAVVSLFAEARMGNAVDTSECEPLVNATATR
jgi:hypothetical protein